MKFSFSLQKTQRHNKRDFIWRFRKVFKVLELFKVHNHFKIKLPAIINSHLLIIYQKVSDAMRNSKTFTL